MRSDWLEAFRVFAESMNFTHAAEALHISQPALHVKIRKLGEALGEPLYRKTGRTLLLTAAGEQVAAFAREQKSRGDAFLDELKTGRSHQPVELVAGEGAYRYLLGPVISRFLEEGSFPLHLHTGDRDSTLDLILSGRAHIGVTALDAQVDGIAAEPIADIGQVLVLPAGHPIAKQAHVTLRDLEGEALVVPPQGRPHRQMLNRMLMAQGVSWHVGVEAQGWDLMMHFARLGIGLAVVNDFCSVPDGLIACPLEELPGVRYHAVHRAGPLNHAGAAAFKQLLLAECGAAD